MAGESKSKKKTTLWGGRFKHSIAKDALLFSESISFDHVLALFDIEQSRTHVQGLSEAKLLSLKERKLILDGLDKVEILVKTNKLEHKIELEDIHTIIEKKLTDLIGPAAKKLHTTRSRNDQVVTDLKLYLRSSCKEIIEALNEWISTLSKLGIKYANAVMPGYTHLQRAMPVTLGHHLLAYAHMAARDLERFVFSYQMMNTLPLGSGALAGINYDIPREKNARRLGFKSPTLNSIDSVSDRDFLIDFLSACASTQMHFSRLSEDLILWATTEFGFLELDDRYATGSSLMPQKKNPDISELTRGKTGRVYANLNGVLTLLKGLPLSYNRDLQEDKIFAFDSAQTVLSTIRVNTNMITKLKFNTKRMADAVQSDKTILATDLADILVREGMPFRETHEVIGAVVLYCLDKNKRLQDLSLKELHQFSPLFPKNTLKLLNTSTSVEQKRSTGGPSQKNARKQVQALQQNVRILLKQLVR